MAICKNCGRETKNKKYCSKSCQFQYKFKRAKKKRSKMEIFISKRLQFDFPDLIIEECNRKVLGNLELDIYLPQLNIGIEINGKMHYQFVRYFHRTPQNFKKQLYRDQLKRIKCRNLGIFLIVIPNLENFSSEYALKTYLELKRNLMFYLSTQTRTCLAVNQ